MQQISIAIDAMSGDFGPRVTIPAAQQALQQFPDLAITLVGPSNQTSPFLPQPSERLQLQHADSVLPAGAKPSDALRCKRDTSLGLSVGLLADGQVHGCVSAANAGSMMGLGRSLLGVFDGIDRPAICAALPKRDGVYHMLDLGANVDCSPQQLLQFAMMGSAYAEVLSAEAKPRLGLLSIGTEAIKGNRQVLEAAELFHAASQSGLIDYQGFIEADQLFNHSLDVVVCDGFTGNIALKTAEGAARFMGEGLRAQFQKSFFSRLCGFFAKPALQHWFERYNPARLNGASLLGLPQAVVKSHGAADIDAFAAAIGVCYGHIKHHVPKRIEEKLKSYSQSRKP